MDKIAAFLGIFVIVLTVGGGFAGIHHGFLGLVLALSCFGVVGVMSDGLGFIGGILLMIVAPVVLVLDLMSDSVKYALLLKDVADADPWTCVGLASAYSVLSIRLFWESIAYHCTPKGRQQKLLDKKIDAARKAIASRGGYVGQIAPLNAEKAAPVNQVQS